MKGGLSRSLGDDLGQASDEELMTAYQGGREEAFMLLYQRHSGKVYAFLLSRLRDRGMADDAFQAAFLKLHRSRGKYDSRYPFAAWLFMISKTAMLSALRTQKRTRENEVVDEGALLNAASVESEAVSLPDLGGLSMNQRQVLELRYSEELSFEEIATRLNTTPENIRQILSRATRKLKTLVQGVEK